MPQLDPSYFGPQLFWLIISFVILLLGMRYIILPRLNSILKSREKLLDKKLAQIQDLESNAEQIAMEAKLQLKEAQDESKKLILKVKAELSQEIIDAKKQLAEKNVQQLHETNDGLKKEVDKIIQEIHEKKPALAAMVLQKILGHEVGEKECKKILEKGFDHDKLD